MKKILNYNCVSFLHLVSFVTCSDSHPFGMANGTVCCSHGLRNALSPLPAECNFVEGVTDYINYPAECCIDTFELECPQNSTGDSTVCLTNIRLALDGKLF